jgi:hypothetical protein
VYYLHTPQPEAVVTDADAVAQALESVSTLHSLQAALEVGQIVFQRVFKSDERLLRARGKKNSSFRKLAAHPRLGMSPSSLWRAVAIFELSRRFPELTQYVHTGVGHISVVLGLPEPEQYRLLRTTESERWTRRRLQKEAAAIRGAYQQANPLPRPRLLDRLAGLELLARDARPESGQKLSPGEAREALDRFVRLRAQLDEAERLVRSAAVD